MEVILIYSRASLYFYLFVWHYLWKEYMLLPFPKYFRRKKKKICCKLFYWLMFIERQCHRFFIVFCEHQPSVWKQSFWVFDHLDIFFLSFSQRKWCINQGNEKNSQSHVTQHLDKIGLQFRKNWVYEFLCNDLIILIIWYLMIQRNIAIIILV